MMTMLMMKMIKSVHTGSDVIIFIIIIIFFFFIIIVKKDRETSIMFPQKPTY